MARLHLNLAMPRIAEEAIERVKRATDLAALVRSRGVDLKKHTAKDFVGCCPFHEEATPSFVVSPDGKSTQREKKR